MSDLPESRRAATRSRTPRRRLVLWVVLAFLLVVVSAALWIGIRALIAKSDLEQSVALVQTLRSQLADGKTSAARSTAEELEDRAAHARRMTSDSIWRDAEVLPLFGPNLRAVRQVSAAVNDIASGAVHPVATILGEVDVDAFKPVDGKVDLRPLVRAEPAVTKATATLRSVQHRVQRIDTSSTVSAVTNAVDQLDGALRSVSKQADTVDRVVRLAPRMLGADGPRKYLLLFQNNAELRAGGGIPGAVALLETEGGGLRLVQQASSTDFPVANEPVLPLTTDTQGLYGSITGEYMQDVTLTPRFDVSARLAREMWKQRYGDDVDGVIAVDPVTLGFLLRATGPVQLPTGDILTTDNAAQLLLSDAYAKYPDPTAQDAFFAAAASTVFEKVSTGGFDPKAFIGALTQAVTDNRVRIWSADQDEQALIDGTPVAGSLPVSDASAQRFGVYLNDGTGAKMDWYLEKSVAVGSTVCRKDGRPTWVVEVTLKSTAPADAATSLPEYVTGGGDYGVPPGQVRTNVAIYAPTSGAFLGASRDGERATPQTALDGRYFVTQFETTLSPGKSTRLRVEVLGPRSAARTAVTAESTPGVHQSVTKPLTVSCQSPLD